MTCAFCGCTDDDCSGCVERTGAPCWWVEPGLCSACCSDQRKASSALVQQYACQLADYQQLPGVLVVILDRDGYLHAGLDVAEGPASNPLRLLGQVVHETIERIAAATGDGFVAAKPELVEHAACIHCRQVVATTSDVDAIRHHSMTCAASPVVQQLETAREQIRDLRRDLEAARSVLPF